MFSDSVHGVKASANLYWLIESAKANQPEPYAYLRHVFTELPKGPHRRRHRSPVARQYQRRSDYCPLINPVVR